MTKKAEREAERVSARAKLRKYFHPGDTAHTQLLSVSSSGMSRHIAVIATAREDRRDYQGKRRVQSVPVNVTWLVAKLLGYRVGRTGGMVVGGCGMDMGFHVVYSMSSAMFPKGTRLPHGRRNGEPDSTGGYAIHHRWL